MDHLVAARRLIAELVKAEQIEVRRAEIVGRELAILVDKLGRTPSGEELEVWLDDHAQVTELYASASMLDELVFRYLATPPSVPAVDARHSELEQQLRADPSNTDLYLVYADWLQERGDPLGELIAFGVAGDEMLFERHLKLHEQRFLGACAAHKNHLKWRNGMVRAVEGASLNPASWRQLLSLRVCELLESITLERGFAAGERALSFGMDESIATHASQTLRSVELVSWGEPLPEQLMQRPLQSLKITNTFGSIAIRALPPTLATLRLHVNDFEHSTPITWNVRELEVSINTRVAPLLEGAQFPNLERLVIVDCPATIELDRLLASMALPALRHLGIDGGMVGITTLTALRAPHLTSLALTNLGLDDDTIGSIVRACRSLPALGELDVSDNELSRDGLARVRELSVDVISRRQDKRGSKTERRIRNFAGSRFHVAEEIADPKAWRHAGQDGNVRWARYRGEDEYELFVHTNLERYACTCPSSIQPCKHVVALMLVAERNGLPSGSDEALVSRVLARHPWLTDV